MAENDLALPEVTPPTAGGLDMDALIRQASGPSDETVKRMGDIQKQESSALSGARLREERRLETDRNEVDRRYQGIEPFDVKPWNADKEKAARTTSPLESFGSMASIFAIAASAFTRQPAINALNGAAAAMNSIRERDDKGYADAYDAWQKNTKLMFERHQVQREAYNDALNLLKTDNAAGIAQIQSIAQRFGDAKMAAMAEGGFIKEIEDIRRVREDTMMKMAQSIPKMVDWNIRYSAWKDDPDAKSEDPNKRMQAYHRAFDPTPRYGTSASQGENQLVNNLTRQIMAENPDMSPTEAELQARKRVAEAKRAPSGGAIANDQHKIYEQKAKEFEEREGRAPTGDERATLLAEAKKPPKDIKPTITDEAAKFEAENLLRGGRPTLTYGRGESADANKTKITNTLTALAAERGITGDKLAEIRAGYSAWTAGMKVLETRAANLVLAEKEAKQLIPRVEALIDTVPRYNLIPLNKLIANANRNIGSEEEINLGIAMNAVKYVYARVLKPTGVLNESDVKRAEDLLSLDWSKGQMRTALKQMNVELDSARSALDDARKDYRGGVSPARKEGYRLGDVLEGKGGKKYRYLGGDPKDQGNYELVE